MGGTDDPSNIVELTVEEHADAHRKLYEQYGKLEDYYAWQGLSGNITKREIFLSLVKRGKEHPFYGKTHHSLSRKKISDNNVGTKWINNGSINKKLRANEILPAGFSLGRLPMSSETKLKISKKAKIQKRKKHTEETKRKMSEAARRRKPLS
jgi:hypothetical protein